MYIVQIEMEASCLWSGFENLFDRKFGEWYAKWKFCYSSTFSIESLQNSWSDSLRLASRVSSQWYFEGERLLIMITKIDKKKFEFIPIFRKLDALKKKELFYSLFLVVLSVTNEEEFFDSSTRWIKLCSKLNQHDKSRCKYVRVGDFPLIRTNKYA